MSEGEVYAEDDKTEKAEDKDEEGADDDAAEPVAEGAFAFGEDFAGALAVEGGEEEEDAV